MRESLPPSPTPRLTCVTVSRSQIYARGLAPSSYRGVPKTQFRHVVTSIGTEFTYASFTKCPAAAAARCWCSGILVSLPITRNPEKTITVGGKSHSAHPDTPLTASTILIPDVVLWHKRPRLGSKVSHNLFLINVNAYNQASVVEKIAVASKRAVYDRSNLGQRRSLQDNASDKVLCRGIVALRAIHENGIPVNIL